MFDSGVMANVQQVSLEYHTWQGFVSTYVQVTQALYKHGFRIIAFDPNLIDRSCFEIVLRKADICLPNA